MNELNIFTEDQRGPHPWILRRAALEIRRAYPETSINGKPRMLNYHVNYAVRRDIREGIEVGHFTHLEGKGHFRKVFLECIDQYDYYTVLCDLTKQILVDRGADPDRIAKIQYGSDERFRQEIVFGVVGRTYPSGRKGEYLVKEMVNAGYTVLSWGKGWPVTPEQDTGRDWDELPLFYKEKIDYLVVTSLNEGGPVPVIDALAAGVPVIAPNTGWCWEFPVIRYEKGSWKSLQTVLHKLTNPPSWELWAKQHHLFFREILKKQ